MGVERHNLHMGSVRNSEEAATCFGRLRFALVRRAESA
jgi:hypothetical protein